MTVIVRQACIEDYPAIGFFILEAWGPLVVYKGEGRWRWQFIENPVAILRGNEVPVWIALDGTRVVGQIAVQRTWLSAGMRKGIAWLPENAAPCADRHLYRQSSPSRTIPRARLVF
jgi:hypothetical protein